VLIGSVPGGKWLIVGQGAGGPRWSAMVIIQLIGSVVPGGNDWLLAGAPAAPGGRPWSLFIVVVIILFISSQWRTTNHQPTVMDI
jgi:hypothetical protein